MNRNDKAILSIENKNTIVGQNTKDKILARILNAFHETAWLCVETVVSNSVR